MAIWLLGVLAKNPSWFVCMLHRLLWEYPKLAVFSVAEQQFQPACSQHTQQSGMFNAFLSGSRICTGVWLRPGLDQLLALMGGANNRE